MRKLLITILLSTFPFIAAADDIDIYGISEIDVKPNVLIIFDNSGSMRTKDVPAAVYDGDIVYAGSKPNAKVFKKKDGVYKGYYPDINSTDWQCQIAKDALLKDGYYQGPLKKKKGVITCGGTSRSYRIGNFINFDENDPGETKRRMEVAKEVIAKLISDNVDTVKFGIMKFHHSEGGYIASPCATDNKQALIGSYDPDNPPVFTDSNQSANYGVVGGMESQTWTPLGETAAEAGLYFAGKNSWFSNGYTGSPIEYRCQKNYIILMTDGEPTKDDNWRLENQNYIINKTIPSEGHDGAFNYLDDVSYFLKHNDIRVIGSNPNEAEKIAMGTTGDFEDQTITTYTIGFKQNLQLLQDTATNGGGEYYTADNASTLNEALNNIITSIKEDTQVFSAAAVPVSRANLVYAGDYVYYGLFQPAETGNWLGNIKKYALTSDGDIVDVNGNAIVNNGILEANAKSFWSTTADGNAVTKGGAGDKLLTDIEGGMTRNIYTYTGTTTDLTDSTNHFLSSNTALNVTSYPELTAEVIDFVRKENGDYPLGDFLHSQPIVVHYDTDSDGVNDQSMVFTGGNDGMLHAFDDNDGSELWAYIPPDLLFNLPDYAAETKKQYFVDGASIASSYDHDSDTTTPDKKILFFGERRGGNYYTALDITSYTAPALQYQVGPNHLGAGKEELGQSWGLPKSLKMGYTDLSGNYAIKDVILLPGGYDVNQDKLPGDTNPPTATDSKGRAVFAIDRATGDLFSNATFSADTFSDMTHSIIAVSGFENPKTRTTTRIYAGDLNGNLFGFRDDIYHYNREKDKKDTYGGFFDGQEDGVWGQKLKLYSSPGKKIFYAPTIVNEYFDIDVTYPAGTFGFTTDTTRNEQRVGDYIFYGTGDRAHPERQDIENAIYAIKNSWQWPTGGNPTIVEAYVDHNDSGKIKDFSDNVLVDQQRDINGIITDAYGEEIEQAGDGTLFILDVTYDLIQNQNTDKDKQRLLSAYVTDALNHPSNRGWFMRFDKDINDNVNGEKIVSSPVVYAGVVYFTTYVPEKAEGTTTTLDDPCEASGARGSGFLYALDYDTGAAAINWDPNNDIAGGNGEDDELIKERSDRRKELDTQGIPPQPVIVVQEGGATIITGFDKEKPAIDPNLLRRYWRQM